jgi:hypothetical protein
VRRVQGRRSIASLGAWALVALLVLASCAQEQRPEMSEPTGGPIVVEGRQDGFLLSLRVSGDTVDAGAPIGIDAILTWDGPAVRATVWASGSGVVSFGLRQLDGDIALGGAMTADCAVHEFDRLTPVAIPFRKSGGFSEDDPNADFYRAFFADPILRLPAGRWRVSAIASGFLEPCEMTAPKLEIALEADVLVR